MNTASEISLLVLVFTLCYAFAQDCDPGNGCTAASCEDTGGACFGEFFPGFCPGPSNIQCCCTHWGTCQAEGKTGNCILGIFCPAGSHDVSGVCPGDNNVVCCVSDGPPPPAPPGPNRKDIIARAQTWVDQGIPYCQCPGNPPDCCGKCPYCDTYRCDCSGYVTFCLQGTPGWNTNKLCDNSQQISPGDMQPGDMVLDCNEHVILFAGWANNDHSAFWGFQEAGCQSGTPFATYSIVPFPMTWGNFGTWRLNGMSSILGNNTAIFDPLSIKPSHEGLFDFTYLKTKWTKKNKSSVVGGGD